MENIEILERLRNYDFFKDIDYTNEFADRLEKFLIMVIKLKRFEFKNGKLLNYDTIKELLKIKNIKIKRSKIACGKLHLQRKLLKNIETLKWRILDDLNVFFKKENIVFELISKENLNENYKEIDKEFKTLFLRLDNVPENEYKNIINYAFDKGYKLKNFSKFETMEKTLETRATFELDR